MTANSSFVKQSKFSVCLKRTEGLQSQKGKCNHNSQAAFEEGMLVLIYFPWCFWELVCEHLLVSVAALELDEGWI